MKTWQMLKSNPQLWPRYFIKEYLIQACREFFLTRNYHELESPILANALPQERFLDVLTTELVQKGKPPVTAYLIPTTERFNKIALAAGLGEHFVITKVCRGQEESGPNHSPEFTMLEWYHLNANYYDLMEDCENLLVAVKKFLDQKFEREHSLKITYQGQKIDLTPPWNRLSLPKAMKDLAGIDLAKVQNTAEFRKVARNKGYHINPDDDWQIIFELIFANEIEPKLATDKPTFVFDYPKQVCPLTQTNKTNPLVCEKVELYLAGKELANGYTELLDWKEQEQRFKVEQAARANLGKMPVKFDSELIAALRSGLPQVAGIGMGLDRVAIILADAKNIAEINLFPGSEVLGDDSELEPGRSSNC
jgi:lysyl-tRNA synthetase, class II